MTPSPRQAVILKWLNRAHPHAGQMFESALWIGVDSRIPCRGRMIAHAHREICTVLMNEYSSNSREVLSDHLNVFAAEFRRAGFAMDAGPGSSPGPDSMPTTVSVSFLKSAAAVVRTHVATENARARARAVFEGFSSQRGPQPDVGPTADRWFRMSGSFTKWAHNRTTPDAQLMEGEFQQEIDFFEETLASFAETAVHNLDALDDILEDANT